MPAEIRSNINSFLRNSLSGVQESPSVANHALVIPLGRRTNLTRARDQINDLFERAEKSFKNYLESNKRTKPAPTPNPKAQPVRRHRRHRSGPHSNLIDSLIGDLLGAAIGFILQNLDTIEKTLNDAWKSFHDTVSGIAQWISETITRFGKAIKNGFEWLTKEGSNLISTAGDYIDSGLKKAGDFLKDPGAIGRIEKWISVAARGLDEALTIGLVPTLADTIVTTGAAVAVRNSVQHFWHNLLEDVRSWLDEFWAALGFAQITKSGASLNDAARRNKNNQKPAMLPQGGIDSAGNVSDTGTFEKTPTPSFNPTGVPPGSWDATSGNRATTGKWWTPARMAHAAERLEKEAGLSKVGAAALVARWAGVEARGGPASVNPYSGAAGIGQWLGSRKPNGIQNWDADDQITYAIKELLTNETKAAKQLRQAKTYAAGAIGASMYERAEHYNPASGMDDWTLRTPVEATQKAIQDYQNSQSPPPASAQAVPDAKVEPAPTRQPSPENRHEEDDNGFYGRLDEDDNIDDIPDHGYHRPTKPVVINNSAGMLVLSANYS